MPCRGHVGQNSISSHQPRDKGQILNFGQLDFSRNNLMLVAELSVCHNLILAFILNYFLHRSFERGQGTSVRFRPWPQGRGQGTVELIQIVQYVSDLYYETEIWFLNHIAQCISLSNLGNAAGNPHPYPWKPAPSAVPRSWVWVSQGFSLKFLYIFNNNFFCLFELSHITVTFCHPCLLNNNVEPPHALTPHHFQLPPSEHK